jgi:signal transduction histidine kinase
MPVRTALDALTLRPTRLLRSSWPGRSVLYLASSPMHLGTTVPALFLLRAESAIPWLVGAAVAVFTALVAAAVPLARLERRRMRLVDREPVADPHRLGDRRATWRELGYTISSGVLTWIDSVVLACTLWFPATFVLAPIREPEMSLKVPVAATGLVLLLIAPYPLTAWAGARAAMARAILAPREDDRLVEVTRSRARLVDAFEIERRRIERDLHDGAQQRLVALTMQLGLARLELPADSPAGEPLAKAHDLARQALTELRELIRGVHPKILADRGLAAAVRDVAGRSPVPVDVEIELPARLPEPIEVTAYFVVVEALANVAKHSAATRAAVTASVVRERLLVRVHDNGVGGADPAGGTGLAGLVDRVAAVDGTVALSSPAGGPTVLQAEFAVR